MTRMIKVRGEDYGRSSGTILLSTIGYVNYAFAITGEILEKMAETDRLLSERLVAIEVKDENDEKILQKLQKESSLQTKLLSAILVALIGAAIKAVLHL